MTILFLTLGLLLTLVVPAISSKCSSLGRTDPKQLARLAATAPLEKLYAELGGNVYERGLHVDLKAPYDFINFDYGDRPLWGTLVVAFPEGTGCTAERQELRRRLSRRLGIRFDGDTWRVGGSNLTFERDCSRLVITVDPDSSSARREALWGLLNIDVFGQRGTLDEKQLDDVLGRNAAREPGQVGQVLAGMSLDDAMANVTSRLPNVEKGSSSTNYEIELAGNLFRGVMVEWQNRQAGGITGLLFRARKDDSLDPEPLALCFCRETGAKCQKRVDDYAKQETSYTFDLEEVTGSVRMGGIILSALHYSALRPAMVKAIFNAVGVCDPHEK